MLWVWVTRVGIATATHGGAGMGHYWSTRGKPVPIWAYPRLVQAYTELRA